MGYRYDGTPFPLPGIDSINMWGLIAGVQQESPRSDKPSPSTDKNARTLRLLD